MYEHPEAIALLQAMADPVRLALIQRMSNGPVAVSDLVIATGHAQSKVSNHLALLRHARIVSATKTGRQVHYQVCNPVVIEMMEVLKGVPGVRQAASRVPAALVHARTCYDHLAGRLGVALFDSLVARKAIEDVSIRMPVRKVHGALGPVALGPGAASVFARLGVDLEAAHGKKRQFATACQDWTENRPHLGGALGAALLERFEDLEWVERQRGSRAMIITGRGRRGLADLGLQLAGTLAGGRPAIELRDAIGARAQRVA